MLSFSRKDRKAIQLGGRARGKQQAMSEGASGKNVCGFRGKGKNFGFYSK